MEQEFGVNLPKQVLQQDGCRKLIGVGDFLQQKWSDSLQSATLETTHPNH
jgi:hypothetical protein